MVRLIDSYKIRPCEGNKTKVLDLLLKYGSTQVGFSSLDWDWITVYSLFGTLLHSFHLIGGFENNPYIRVSTVELQRFLERAEANENQGVEGIPELDLEKPKEKTEHDRMKDFFFNSSSVYGDR